MKYLVVESLKGPTVARVEPIIGGKYSVTGRARTRRLVEELIDQADQTPLPLLIGNRKVRTARGHVSRSEGSFFKPGDEDFLDALADVLTKHKLYSYTVETDSD